MRQVLEGGVVGVGGRQHASTIAPVGRGGGRERLRNGRRAACAGCALPEIPGIHIARSAEDGAWRGKLQREKVVGLNDRAGGKLAQRVAVAREEREQPERGAHADLLQIAPDARAPERRCNSIEVGPHAVGAADEQQVSLADEPHLGPGKHRREGGDDRLADPPR